MHLILFEDAHWRRLVPLALSRPVFSLVCGIEPIWVNLVRIISPDRITLWVRPSMEPFCRRHILPLLPCPATINTPLDDQPALLINGRSIPHDLQTADSPGVNPQISISPEDPGTILSAQIVGSPGLTPNDALTTTHRWQSLLPLPHAPTRARSIRYLWDLLAVSPEAITAAAATLVPNPIPVGPYHILHPDAVFLGNHVTLSPGVVLDASAGPIILADHVVIGANSVVAGPCYIGPGSTLAPLTQIRGGTSIGPRCKVGGEISNSIIIGHSNKAHDGFLGDSCLGEWINLGAGTVTSNLKNTYGRVTMPTIDGPVDTGRQFVGSMIGDHAKTAVGTRLMTGSYVGYGSMIATTAPPPRVVPSLTFLTDTGPQPYDLDKAATVMAAVFGRRGHRWTGDDATLNQTIRDIAPSVEPAVPIKPEPTWKS